MATSRKAAVGFIFITLLIDVMGWGLIIPVIHELIAELKNIPVNEASPYGGLLLTAYALTQFIFAPLVGNLSDKYGRRRYCCFPCWGLLSIIYSWRWRPIIAYYLSEE